MKTVSRKSIKNHSGKWKVVKKKTKFDVKGNDGDEDISDNSDNDWDGEETLEDSQEDEAVTGSYEESEVEEEKDVNFESESEVDDSEDADHKKSLQQLKTTDPEFFKFLEENDKKLLQFSVSDSDEDAESDIEGKTDKLHRPPTKLKVDSEESDFEAEDDEKVQMRSGVGKVVTLAIVSQWRNDLKTNPCVSVITDVIKGFHAALQRVSGVEEDIAASDYRVDGSSVFNAIVQLCVMDLQPALARFLRLPPGRISRSVAVKSKKWIKIKTVLKGYFVDLLKLLSGVASGNILSVLLKHAHQMSPLLSAYSGLTKAALRQFTSIWSADCGGGEEPVRVLAFLCILRITTNDKKSLLDSVLKMMYVSYIRNAKFVSPSTLPGIAFMRVSLAEIFALEPAIAYHHGFLYIRQLAIHLRNAVTLHKKECTQSVYNWQYVASLRLWVDLLCITVDKQQKQLQQLLYPIVQIIIGCIKLVPTAQYHPLRFHCLDLLVKLSRETDTFIPVLPFILEVLVGLDVNKGHKTVSMKPQVFTCVLRLSKTAMQENGYKDAVIENVYRLLIEYLSAESHRISFPDMVVPAVIQLRAFLKGCKVSKYTSKLRQALAKIEENARAVEVERRRADVALNDAQLVQAWERALRGRGTPLGTFHTAWAKVHAHQQAKRVTDNDKIGEFNIPTLLKRPAKTKANEGTVELFPSSDESDASTTGFRDSDKEPKQKKRRRKQNPEIETVKEEDNVDDQEDIIEDFRLSDME